MRKRIARAEGSNRGRTSWLVVAAVCALPAVSPGSPLPEAQQVTVTAGRVDTEEHAYRDMLDAMTRFAPYHQAHPDALLRFRIRQRKEMKDVDIASLMVYIVDPEDGTRTPIQVASDGGFTLPVLPDPRDHGAIVRTNMPPGSLAWYVQISREGADPRDRILGDIRMECKLDVQAADLRRKIKNPAYYAMKAAMSDVCRNNPLVHWDAYSEKPLFAVHLRSGAREKSLNEAEGLHGALGTPLLYPTQDWSYLLMDYTYWPPVGDASWPDETTIHITYTDDRPSPPEGRQ